MDTTMVQSMDRRANDKVPWYLHPAWVTLFLMVLFQGAVALYQHASLTQRVEDMQGQLQVINTLVLTHIQQHTLCNCEKEKTK
jgi:hypothetical protein